MTRRDPVEYLTAGEYVTVAELRAWACRCRRVALHYQHATGATPSDDTPARLNARAGLLDTKAARLTANAYADRVASQWRPHPNLRGAPACG